MKKKALAVIITFALSAATMSAATVQPVLAQDTGSQTETADYLKIAGFWKNTDSGEEETLTITEDGLFTYHTKETEDFQGYLEYVDEYGDGNGRYDMYNRIGIWLAGIYQDSENSLHMGNEDGTVFTRTEENGDTTAEEQGEEAQNPTCVLTAAVQYTGLKSLYNNSDWNNGYFYSDMTEDGLTVIVNCCAANGEDADGMSKEFREEFAAMVSESEVTDYQDSQNQSLTEKFTYPVYDITFTTGANEDTCLWKMIFFQTDTHTYAYAFRMDADTAEYMEEEYRNAVDSLELMDISYNQTEEVDYDPSANGESLESFIAYFDSWYQYGDLNAESICLYGDGTWAYYNAVNADGTGGYLFDSGTFSTSGTSALQLYSSDGTYVAYVSLNSYGELMLTPVSSGYGSVYADAAFVRASQSVAYEAQDTGDGYGDYIPEEDNYYEDNYSEDNYYEEDGTGDYSPYVYSEYSDPGETYYWYDGEGGVMYFDGLDNIYIGSTDVYYIDDAGRLCQF
ncbi:MAG: hypothetical protein SOX32_07880 [Candidatus Choladocola sp.]|nr:hypothetical protein [Candidatus Choladocola sp.]